MLSAEPIPFFRWRRGLASGAVLLLTAALGGCGPGDPPEPPSPPGPASTYTVGGTVSGLNGSVTLTNNGGNARVVTTNGSFAFTTALTGGSAYSVAISAQPTGQTCVVTNGSGTLASSNVTNVTVTCTTNTHTVGGTVSGLAGSGLVLQNNGGDTLPRSADGTFTFATSIAFGGTYNVTVLAQPNNPGQTCTPTSNTGTIAGNVANVSISCVTTAVAPSITAQPANQSVVEPATAAFSVTASGTPTPTLQWQLSTNAGSTWGNIAGATASSYTTAATATTDSGKQYRVIATNSAGSATSNAATLTVTPPPSGKSWQPSTRISSAGGTPYDIYDPQVASNANGYAVAVWEQADGNAELYDIWANRYVPGSGWQSPARIGPAGSGPGGPAFAGRPQVAIDPAGNIVVVFEVIVPITPTGTTGHIERVDVRATYYTAGGSWSPALPVAPIDDPYGAGAFIGTSDPHVAITDSGVAVAIWTQGDGRNNAIMYATGDAGGWGVTSPLAVGNVGGPNLSVSKNGSAVAVWVQFDGTEFHTWASRFGGAGWTAPTQVDHVAGSSGYPTAGFSANGEAVVAWAGANYSQLWSARYTGGAWSERRLSNTSDTVNGANGIQVAMDASGNAIVKWTGAMNGTFGADFIARLTGGTWNNGIPHLFPSAGGGLRVAMNASGQALSAFNGAGNPLKPRANTDYSLSTGSTTALDTEGFGPKIAIDDNGNAVAIWVKPDGGANRLWASDFR